jgi:alpha-beta hydrolase superfamily lysophospholipase
VVQAHGIATDLDEGGMFARLAERLAHGGWTVLRFSFRGHGRSDGTQRGVTIAGEMLDLQAAVEHVAARYAGPLAVVASSLGAVSTTLSLPALGDQVERLVLWNPVLDLRRTFLEPELPWGKENFGPAQQRLLRSQGFLVVDGEFELGRVLFEEFRHYRPSEYFLGSEMPSLIVHGDQDASVSYAIARDTARLRGNCAFHTVAGSDHGFDSREREDEAINVTANWLEAQHSERT